MNMNPKQQTNFEIIEKKITLKWIHVIPGIVASFILACLSERLGHKYPIIGGPVIAIIIGIFITTCFPNLTKHTFFHHKKQGAIQLIHGIKYTSKKLLQYSIVLLGFEMNLYHVIQVGGKSLYIMLFTLSAAFIVAYLMGKFLTLSNETTILIGVGTSICGGSAIAATAPVIHANDEDVARAISTIFLFNIIAVIIFPLLGHLMNMDDIAFGMWAGTAINDTSSVVAAGTTWSNASGNNTALTFAIIVKLTRVLMIVPITLFLAIYNARKKDQATTNHFSFINTFPWFILLFIIVAIINTFANIPTNISHDLVILGKFIIVMAMAAIGLNTNLKKLLTNGFKPILLGLCCWVTVAIISLIVQDIMM